LPDWYLANYILLGMVGFFTAVVRAPITGAVLITEMAGSFAHFPAFILVSVVASIVAGLLRTKPIYDSLLEQIKPDKAARSDAAPIILDIPVFEGSVLDTTTKVNEIMPVGCILVSVERGDEELFPERGLDVHPGDVLRVVVERAAPEQHRMEN